MSSGSMNFTDGYPGTVQPEQRVLFRRLGGQLAFNAMKVMIEKQRLRFFLIIVLGIVIWGGLLYLFIEGFEFLRGFDFSGNVSMGVTELIFGLFFVSVTGLTLFSTGLMIYGNLFSSAETAFLLASPARADQVFAHKYRETLMFTGWSFFLLGTPMMISFGILYGASWVYYAIMPFFLVGFLLLPSAVGAMACLLVVTFLTRNRRAVLIGIVGIVLVVAITWIISAMQGIQRDRVSPQWIEKLIDHIKPTKNSPPASWMTEGLVALVRVKGDVPLLWKSFWGDKEEVAPLFDALYYLGLVWAYGLMAYLVATVLATRWYRKAYDMVMSETGNRRKFGASWSDKFVTTLLGWSDIRTRTFVLKDWRMFRRDVSQWAQVVILGGIMLLYCVSIPSLPHGQYGERERALIGLLNVAVTGLMMATFTSRFVFPLMSMEGRNFWILSLLPIERDRLLTSKLVYAASFTTFISVVLILLSEVMLRLPWPIVLTHVLGMAVLTIGLSSLAVGLGAFLVNLKETNPSKIATGFGGTINLLFSLGYAITVVAVTSIAGVLYYSTGFMTDNQEVGFVKFLPWLGLTLLLLIILGGTAIAIPMRLGRRAFRTMEF
jgi:ABC-2 type transport system permease protein